MGARSSAIEVWDNRTLSGYDAAVVFFLVPRSRPRMTGHSTRVSSTLAYVAAVLLLAGVNATCIASRLNDGLRDVTRWGVHFYDVSLFVLLGLLCGLLAWLWRAVAERWPNLSGPHQARLALVVLGTVLGAVMLEKDFANFASKQELPVGPLWLGALAGMVASAGLVLAQWVLRGRLRLGYLAGLAALGLAYANGSVLEDNYPGIHFVVALTALVLLAVPLRRMMVRLPLRPAATCLVAALLVGLVPVLMPPTRAVRQNLSVSAGSVLTPFVVPWLPQRLAVADQRLAIENSEWFKSRDQVADIPATASELLPPNGAVLLLTVEALRADVVESRKHDDVLPNLARLRDEGLRFTMARSPTPSTLTTVTSLLTGKYYSQIYFTEHEPGKVNPITDRSVRVPNLLSKAGVRTVHARAVHGLGSNFGVGRGFDVEPATPKSFGRAKELMDIILGELKGLKSDPQRRLFLYGHFVDSHAPYTLGGKRATQFDSYLAELALIDRELGRLLEYLDKQSLSSRCLLIVSADHGEAFGEHRMRYHALSVYDELLRVPLLFHHPRLQKAAIGTPVTTLDLSPTILDVFGLPTPGCFMGQSMKSLLLGGTVKFTRPIAADSGRRKQALFFPDGIKVLRDLQTDTVQVFDLRRDPKELHELTDTQRDVEPYIGATERFFETHTLKIPGWKPPWRTF